MMEARTIKILLIEDNSGDARLIQELLRESQNTNFQIQVYETFKDGMQGLLDGDFDIVLLDLTLPDSPAEKTIESIANQTFAIPFIVLTGYEDNTLAVRAVRMGAQDYLSKDGLEKALLVRVIEYSIERHRLRNQLEVQYRELERSQLRLQNIIDSMTSGILIFEKSGHIISQNPVFESLMDIDTIERTVSFLTTLKDETHSKEIVFTSKAGAIKYADVRVVPTKWGNREVLLACFHDLTERKQAENTIAISQRFLEFANRLSNIDELIQEYIDVISELTDCEHISIRLLDIQNRTVQKTYQLGTSLECSTDLFKYLKDHNCICCEIINGNFNHPALMPTGSFMFSNGNEKPLDGGCLNNQYQCGAIISIKSEDRVMGLLTLASSNVCRLTPGIIEILEKAALQLGAAIVRIKSQEALQRSESELSVILNHAPLVIVLLDEEYRIRKGNRELTVYSGESIEHIVGERLGKVLGCRLAEIESKEFLNCETCDSCGILKPIRETFDLKKTKYRDDASIKTYVDGQEELREFLISTAFLTIENQPLVLACIEDVTDRKREASEHKQMTAQLLQAQKMEALGTLTGGVAHDFNNLLTVINGYNSLMIEDFNDPETLMGDIEEIRKACNKATSLTQQLLAFSRKQKVDFDLINLNDVVHEMEKMLRRLIGEDIFLTVAMEHEVLTIKANVSNVQQTIMNLCVNARDAMPHGGDLVISTHRMTLGKEHCKLNIDAIPGEYAVLTVTDNGIGMEPEFAEHIFEPFFTSKDEGKGSGLGLSVVYGIIKHHQGFIQVESQPGSGTAFQVYIPIHKSVVKKAYDEKQDLEGMRGNNQKILLVEDDHGVRKFAQKVLERYGYNIYIARSVEEALVVYSRNNGEFDLIFSDVILTDRTGLDLAQELLLQNKELVFLFASGYTGHKSHGEMIDKMGFRFLQKPYSIKDLLSAISSILKSI